jgi:hypothetical protein
VPEYRTRILPSDPSVRVARRIAFWREPARSRGGLRVTGTFRSTWGYLGRASAKREKGSPRSARMSSTRRAVSSPSPAGEASKKRTCPEGSPPRTDPLRSISRATYLSPTGVRRSAIPRSRRKRSSPKFAITVDTTVFRARAPFALRWRAQSARTWSPSRTVPVSSTKMARSASPSKATPRWARSRRTIRAIPSGWRAPHPALMLVPSGEARVTITRAPRRRKTEPASRDAAPCAQSRAIVKPRSGRQNRSRKSA